MQSTIVEDSLTDMGDFSCRRRRPKHRRNSVDNAKQLMLSLLKRAFSLLQFINVEENPVPPNDLPLIISQRHATTQMPAILTIRTTETHLILKRLAGGDGRHPFTQVLLKIIGVSCCLPARSGCLFRRY